MREPRSAWVPLLLVVLLVALPEGPARAANSLVPVPLQADLIDKVAFYDRGLRARADGTARVLIVERPTDADSRRTAAQMKTALEGHGSIAGLPHKVLMGEFVDPHNLAERCEAEQISIVYLAGGLGPLDAQGLAAALEGHDVLTITSDPSLVEDGVVLAFDLISGQAKVVVNLPQAERQGVDLAAQLLSVAKVIR